MSILPRTIRRDTRVFISAVTRELGSVRKLVKKGLEDNDYHAVEQDNFPPDYRDLVDKLRERIDSCDAVVHIAGHCYGAEPGQRPRDAPRRSCTQLEYDIAVKLKRPVYVFLTGDGFPADPHEPEPPLVRKLQQAHRERLTSTGRDYNPTRSIEQFDQKIRSLRLKVERLEGELRQVDQKVAVTGRRVRRWLIVLGVMRSKPREIGLGGDSGGVSSPMVGGNAAVPPLRFDRRPGSTQSLGDCTVRVGSQQRDLVLGPARVGRGFPRF